MVCGKLSNWESSVRKQMFNVCELLQEIFLLHNLGLCSSTCEMYSTLEWCCSTHGDEGKIFFLGLYWVFFAACGLSLVAASRGYSLVAVRGLLIVVASLVEYGL